MPAERLTSVLPTLRCEKMDGALMSYQSAPVSLGHDGRRRALAGEGVDNALLDALRESDEARGPPTRLLALRKALVLADSHDERLKLGACQHKEKYNGSTAASERRRGNAVGPSRQRACDGAQSERRSSCKRPTVRAGAVSHATARSSEMREPSKSRYGACASAPSRTPPRPTDGQCESRAGA